MCGAGSGYIQYIKKELDNFPYNVQATAGANGQQSVIVMNGETVRAHPGQNSFNNNKNISDWVTNGGNGYSGGWYFISRI